jgi:hypothetical protein
MTMTLILKRITNSALLLAACFFAFGTSTVNAQESLTLSISPSLFDMSVNPGQEWRSTLRVINVNNYDLTVYIDVVNFSPQGESGQGRFLPVMNGEGEGVSLAEWFTIEREAIVIPREKSREIPFSVRVPFDASPGGHFAAILVGTRPLAPEVGQAKVQTSQMVTSLFFARVAGDIIEQGNIREFTTAKRILGKPEVTFDLRFENKGNVHLQPQGEIKITNMWGQERGIIPINQGSQFGNVLPDSIRKFTFSWKGEWSIADMGRYTAVATLAYGTESRQFTSLQTEFWVIPFKLLFGILLGFAVFAALISWFVRLYVRHMLVMAGINVEEYQAAKKNGLVVEKFRSQKVVKLHTPVTTGFTDLKYHLATAKDVFGYVKQVVIFVRKYQLFFIAILVISTFIGLVVWYVTNANTDQRGYEVIYENADSNVTLSSEEIIYNQLRSERKLNNFTVGTHLPVVKVINRAGPGLGAEVKLKLEALGYDVVSLQAERNVPQKRTVIIYPAGAETEALRLSSALNNAPISTYDTSSGETGLTVYVGEDMTRN